MNPKHSKHSKHLEYLKLKLTNLKNLDRDVEDSLFNLLYSALAVNIELVRISLQSLNIYVSDFLAKREWNLLGIKELKKFKDRKVFHFDSSEHILTETNFKEVCKINSIQRLSFKGLCPEYLKDLNKLNNLHSLSFRNVCKIPIEILKNENINRIEIYSEKPLEIPKEIFEMDLDELTINGCGLTEIPVEIQNFKNLNILNLKGNKIKEVSTEVLSLENLRMINLTFNCLENLPIELLDLKNINWIEIEHNHFENLPNYEEQVIKMGEKVEMIVDGDLNRFGLGVDIVEHFNNSLSSEDNDDVPMDASWDDLD